MESRGYSLVAVRGLLTGGASLVSEDRLCGLQWSWHVGSVVACPGLQSTGSIVVVHRLSFSEACGIFLDRRLNPHLLHRQVDSLPLSHQGSPHFLYLWSGLAVSLHLGYYQPGWKAVVAMTICHVSLSSRLNGGTWQRARRSPLTCLSMSASWPWTVFRNVSSATTATARSEYGVPREQRASCCSGKVTRGERKRLAFRHC